MNSAAVCINYYCSVDSVELGYSADLEMCDFIMMNTLVQLMRNIQNFKRRTNRFCQEQATSCRPRTLFLLPQ